MAEELYFVSREGSWCEPMRPDVPPIGKSVKNSDRYWTVYKWIDRKARSVQVIRRGYTLKGARIKARQLNYGLAIEEVAEERKEVGE